ncbi:GNAT family N-acetyltransferase [Rhodoblastus sp.]|jgi:GNAT superfamily N-acetyltransferase|uniref:GNAT family N-acetyltransferase n=1 Tax=Rhodoblastus sp. TaxID=1962975 RepID=UPI0025D94F7E|nr:GNAT family N-acetyltransferase [Rhodoblastus sp.]
MKISIRPIQRQDEAVWRRLWAQYLAFYRKTLPEAETSCTWRRILDPASQLLGRAAVVDDGTPLGFAVCVLHEGTWSAAPTCYLEDLFVDEANRGEGIGGALIEDLLGLARTLGWASVYWVTEADNAAARRLYDRFGLADGYVRYRIYTQPSR